MEIILITGSLGLIGFETTNFFLEKKYIVIGIDNNLRSKIFNIKTDYEKKLFFLKKNYKNYYFHFNNDIRDKKKIERVFKKYKKKVKLIIHVAAQTSHDWSAKDPVVDFSINSLGTFNLLELYRKYCSSAVFIFTSTNKVYGDRVNFLSLKELKTRYDLDKKDRLYMGIREDFPIDQSLHSPFGVSKASADLLVQEYGRYFGLKTGVFRLGVVAGGGQNGAFEQGFLSYMVNKFIKKEGFKIIGYKGKQVRDIIHARDVVDAFYQYYKKPKKGEVYNLGGGRSNAYSILELIEKIQILTGKKLKSTYYVSQERKGDHKWWITDFSKFIKDYPNWKITKTVDDIILEIYKNDFLRKV